MEQPRTLGDHLRRRRLDLGLTQRGVAQILGTSEASIGNWETNRATPKVYLIPRIAEFLGYLPREPVRTFPEVLRAYRRAAGLSRKRLAKLAGLDEATLAKWERGESRPMRSSLEQVRRVFDLMGMPMPEFGREVFSPHPRLARPRRRR